jgi:hypothetical protein
MPNDSTINQGQPMTWRKILQHQLDDPEYPSDRRAYDGSRVKKALAWDAAPTWQAARSPIKRPSKYLDRPFNHLTIDELFAGLRAAELRLTTKTLGASGGPNLERESNGGARDAWP